MPDGRKVPLPREMRKIYVTAITEMQGLTGADWKISAKGMRHGTKIQGKAYDELRARREALQGNELSARLRDSTCPPAVLASIIGALGLSAPQEAASAAADAAAAAAAAAAGGDAGAGAVAASAGDVASASASAPATAAAGGAFVAAALDAADAGGASIPPVAPLVPLIALPRRIDAPLTFMKDAVAFSAPLSAAAAAAARLTTAAAGSRLTMAAASRRHWLPSEGSTRPLQWRADEERMICACFGAGCTWERTLIAGFGTTPPTFHPMRTLKSVKQEWADRLAYTPDGVSATDRRAATEAADAALGVRAAAAAEAAAAAAAAAAAEATVAAAAKAHEAAATVVATAANAMVARADAAWPVLQRFVSRFCGPYIISRRRLASSAQAAAAAHAIAIAEQQRQRDVQAAEQQRQRDKPVEYEAALSSSAGGGGAGGRGAGRADRRTAPRRRGGRLRRVLCGTHT